MKSLERRFDAIQKRNPSWSSLTCFAMAINGQGFSKQTVARWFNKLVPKEEYSDAAKKEVMSSLEDLANPLRTTKNQPKSPP
jgi:hypothetical protein